MQNSPTKIHSSPVRARQSYRPAPPRRKSARPGTRRRSGSTGARSPRIPSACRTLSDPCVDAALLVGKRATQFGRHERRGNEIEDDSEHQIGEHRHFFLGQQRQATQAGHHSRRGQQPDRRSAQVAPCEHYRFHRTFSRAAKGAARAQKRTTAGHFSRTLRARRTFGKP